MDMSQEQAPTLSEVLERLEALIDWEQRDRAPADRGQAMRVDLEPVTDLLSLLGRPDLCLCYVHVAGTKGKGSVASLVAAGLKSAGLRVGRFASPWSARARLGCGLVLEDEEDSSLCSTSSSVLLSNSLVSSALLIFLLFCFCFCVRWRQQILCVTLRRTQANGSLDQRDPLLFWHSPKPQ